MSYGHDTKWFILINNPICKILIPADFCRDRLFSEEKQVPTNFCDPRLPPGA